MEQKFPNSPKLIKVIQKLLVLVEEDFAEWFEENMERIVNEYMVEKKYIKKG